MAADKPGHVTAHSTGSPGGTGHYSLRSLKGAAWIQLPQKVSGINSTEKSQSAEAVGFKDFCVVSAVYQIESIHCAVIL